MTTSQLSLPSARVSLSDRLYRYQKIGANYLFQRERALLADEMGLGKSVQAIAALRASEGAVVVCPASLTINWVREFSKFRPEIAARVVDALEGWPVPGEAWIVSYNRLPEPDLTCPRCKGSAHAECPNGPCDACCYLGTIDCSKCSGSGRSSFPRWGGNVPSTPVAVVFDEAHYLKTPKSGRTLAARALAGVCKRVWLLTGTPILNRPSELWALLQGCRWAGREVFGSWEEFVRLFDGRRQHFGGYAWGPNVSPEARARLGGFMLRRTRAEVLPELPTKIHRDLVVPLSKKTLAGGDFSHIAAWDDDRVLEECAPEGSLFGVRRELAEARHEAVAELCDEHEDAREPLVVFSQHTAIVDELRGRKGWAAITGADAPRDRDRAVRLFQDGALHGIAGTIGAMGVGLTLTRAAHVLFVDRSWVPAENLQAEDRLCRIGQDRGVVVTRLSSDHPVDRRVGETLARKEALMRSAGL